MEEGENLDNCIEDIDGFYVVDSWDEKSSRSDIKCNSSFDNIIPSLENKLSRRKPTEGEIDEFLENLKQSKYKCGTSGLEGSISNSFEIGNLSGHLTKIPEGKTWDKLSIIKNQATKQFSQPVETFKYSTVSYKPGETLTKTIFNETSFNDISKSINNNQEIHIPSSDSLFHVSLDRNEDSGGGFSDVKGSQYTNRSCEAVNMENSSRLLRRGRSRSPYASSTNRYSPVRENDRFPPREEGRNHSHFDSLRNDRDITQDRRHREDIRRYRRSRSRSRERNHERRRSYERRSNLNLSPPPKRESINQSSMEPRPMPPYYQSSGVSMPPDSSFINPNPNFALSTPGPVQYPINSVSSNPSYGRYPGYNAPANNLFNCGPLPPQSFQSQMPPQNQYPNSQTYNLYNPVMQGNPPNPVSYPATWNQSSVGCNQNYSLPNLSTTDAVMYPHLKIGQSRLDSYKTGHRESLGSSSPHRQHKSSFEKKIRSISRSPDRKKHKRKASKRHSKSPSLDRKFEDNHKRYTRHSRSPVETFRYDSKKPKVIIDPNRIPTPPPPPIVGSYKKEESKKSVEPKAKTIDRKSDVDPLSEFLNKESVSLSCLLEAVMETSGQGKSQLSDPKVKKEIISNCESKIQHLYKRRMTGLGAFIPDPVQPRPVIAYVSPLVSVYSPFTYNCEEEDNDWHCPDIIVPDVKMKKDLKVPTSQVPFNEGEKQWKTNIENPTVIPTLSNNQSSPEFSCNTNKAEHLSQNTFPNAYDNSQRNMFPPHQGPQAWSNTVHPQNPYTAPPSIPGSANDYSSLGSTPYMPPSYPFPHRPPGPQFIPTHGYTPQPEVLTYPPRMDYPPMHHFPPHNLNHPGMFTAPQPDSNGSNYQYKIDDTRQLKKPNLRKENKYMHNDNLILLSNHFKPQPEVSNKKIDQNFPEDKFKRNERESYNKLNYAEMLEDSKLDTMHDYQLTNLRERIETCLAEGKTSPGHSRHRSRDRKEGDREKERQKDRDRTRDKMRDSERSRRGSMKDERKWHCRSPFGDERKKGRLVEGHTNHEHYRKSKESYDKKDNCKTSSREDAVEVLSDEDRNKLRLSESGTNGGSVDPDGHLKPSEKTLLSLIIDTLGPEIRKIQEKSDVYKSVIDNLNIGHKSYKRLYSFRNHVLMKNDKDNRTKMIIPRDELREVVTLIHKSLHHVQREELSSLLKNIAHPYLAHTPRYVSKVMSECPVCIEEKKKNDELLIDQKKEGIERKPEKKNNKSLKDRDWERRNSAERYKRVSNDRRSSSSSSRSRRDPPRSGREKDIKDCEASDGRPSGYEKATKTKKLALSSTISDEVATGYQYIEEKSNLHIDVKSSEPLDGLSDKALEFKHVFKSVTDVSVDDRSNIPEGFIHQGFPASNTQNNDSPLAYCEEIKNNLEDKEKNPRIDYSGLAMEPEKVSSEVVTKSQTESANTLTKPEIEHSNTVASPVTEFSNTVTKPETESSNTITKTKMEPSNAVIKPESKSTNIVKKNEFESSNITKDEIIYSTTVTKSVFESSNVVSKDEIKCSNTVTKSVIELSNTVKSSDQVTEAQHSKQNVSSISEPSDSLKVDSVDKNKKLNESASDTGFEANKLNSRLCEESKENNFKEVKASFDQKVNDVNSKTAPKLDFKGRVRQVQMSSNECKNVIKALESKDATIVVDPSYVMKGGMLCRNDSNGNTVEIKIVVPCDELEKIVNIVHTMSAVHTPSVKVVAFFSKHFTQVENLDLKVNEIIANCSNCKLKSS